MGWNDYGFPNPTFMLPYFPYLAMYLANKERYEIQSGNTYNQIAPAPLGTIAFNRYPFWPIYVSNYINQFIDTSQHPTSITWTTEAMVQAIRDRDVYDIGEILPTAAYDLYMQLDWPVKYLQQAKLNMNLLKIASIPTIYISYGVGNSVGVWSTAQDAYNNAVSHFTNVFSGDIPLSSFPGICSTTITNTSNKYSCYIFRITDLRVSQDHYSGIELLPAKFHFSFSPAQSLTFDAHGTSIAGIPSVYHSLPLPYTPAGIVSPDYMPNPTNNTTKTCTLPVGVFPEPHCAVDVSSLFEFYENVDEIPTP